MGRTRTGIRCAALFAAVLAACAAQAAETGGWLGSGWSGPVPYAVRLQLDANGGELRLGAPLACRLPLSRDGDGYVGGLSATGGAACDRLTGQRLTVRREGPALRVDGLSTATLALRVAGDPATAVDARTLELAETGVGAVALRLDAATLGQRSGEWRQGAPASCRIALELAAVDAGWHWHVFTASSTGGRCDRLVGGVVVIPAAPGGTATVRDGRGRDIVLAPR